MSAIRDFRACRQSLVGQRRTDKRGDNLIQIGEAFDSVRESLLVDLGIFVL